MTKRSDKKVNTPPNPSSNAGPTAGEIKANTRPAEPGDDQTYDPVGMAGKKAGKVAEIEEQVRKEGTTGKGTERK